MRMPDIYEVGKQVRELRTTLRGQGISQEELAQAVETTANAVLPAGRLPRTNLQSPIWRGWLVSLELRSPSSSPSRNLNLERTPFSARRRTWTTTTSKK